MYFTVLDAEFEVIGKADKLLLLVKAYQRGKSIFS